MSNLIKNSTDLWWCTTNALPAFAVRAGYSAVCDFTVLCFPYKFYPFSLSQTNIVLITTTTVCSAPFPVSFSSVVGACLK